MIGYTTWGWIGFKSCPTAGWVNMGEGEVEVEVEQKDANLKGSNPERHSFSHLPHCTYFFLLNRYIEGKKRKKKEMRLEVFAAEVPVVLWLSGVVQKRLESGLKDPRKLGPTPHLSRFGASNNAQIRQILNREAREVNNTIQPTTTTTAFPTSTLPSLDPHNRSASPLLYTSTIWVGIPSICRESPRRSPAICGYTIRRLRI